MVDYQSLPVGPSTLAFCPMPQVESVAVGLWFKVGSLYERRGLHGGAHFLEHLLFKGTRQRNALQISREIEGRGGDLNAFTAEEMTCYHARLAADHLELALEVLFDMLWHSTFPADEVERERGVILEEIRMYEDQPAALVMERLNQALWPRYGLGRPITGTPAAVAGMRREELLDFWLRHYTPESLVVSVAGGVERERVTALVARHLGAARRRYTGGALPLYRAPAAHRPALAAVAKPVQQCHFALGARAWPKTDRRRCYALKLLSVVLGENMSSRLFQTLRERHGLVYSIQSSTVHFHATGAFYVQAAVDPPKLDRALALTTRELQKAAARTVSARELRQAKDYLTGQIKLHLESTNSRMMWMGESLVGLGMMLQPGEMLDALARVSAAEVRAVAGELFQPGRLALSVVGPEGANSELKSHISKLQLINSKLAAAN
ncbi:MAG: insulinase family protein [Verrucomicrobiales bacterium]|jgi:predicted Zn-dependent peptidase|nr:insulinase family protein [Verrucomicrobiales bacterium]